MTSASVAAFGLSCRDEASSSTAAGAGTTGGPDPGTSAEPGNPASTGNADSGTDATSGTSSDAESDGVEGTTTTTTTGGDAADTLLGAFAAALSSGQWGQWTDGDTATFKSLSVYTGATPNRSSLEYSNQIYWNSASQELHHRGGGASSGGGNLQRHLRYGATRNEWDAVTPWHGDWAHQWGNLAHNPQTGDLYFRQRDSTNVYKWAYEDFPATADNWTLDSTGIWTNSKNAQCLEFFPDLNDGVGGLVYFHTHGGHYTIYGTNDAAFQNWVELASQPLDGDHGIEGFAAWIPAEQCIMFGGGSREDFQAGNTAVIGRLDADGTAYPIGNAPRPFGTRQPALGTVVSDPASGRTFGISAAGGEMWEWDRLTDSWTSRGALPFDGYWLSACIIPEYGCIYAIVQLGSGAADTVQEWIYKL